MKVRDAMNTQVITVRESDSALDGLKLLLTKGISGAPVVNENSDLIGVVTEFDLLLAIDHVGEQVPISKIMTEGASWVSPDTSLDEARELMLGHNWRRLPVVEDDKIVGVLSRRDILRVHFGL